jgi:flagellar protein FlaG
MSGESISSAILTIASVVCAFSFASIVYPSVISAGDPIVSRTNTMGDQILTDIEILHETTAAKGLEVHIWVKNVGPKGISSSLIPDSDLFFGKAGKFERIPYDENGSLAPCWNYSIEQSNDDNWDKRETLKIRLKPVDVPVSRVKYFIKFSAYNGVSEEAYFTVS